MTLRLRHKTLATPFKDPFKIARTADSARAVTVIVDLVGEADGATGVGEGFPDRYYGETPGTMASVLPQNLDTVRQ